MDFLGRLKADKSTFNEKQRLIVSEKLGIIVRAEVDNFETDEQCEKMLQLFSLAPEMLQDLIDITWLIEQGATYREVKERIMYTKQLIKKATIL